MADEEVKEAPESEGPPKLVEQKKAEEPIDDLAQTIDRLVLGVQAASVKSVSGILTQFQAKMDALIAKLDAGVGDPPKKD